MKRLLLTVGFSIALAGASLAADKINVLLVTGDDVDVHPWAEVSQSLKQMLTESGKFETRISEDVGILDSSTALARYDVVLLHMYTASPKAPKLSQAGKENLVNFVKGGKGLVVSHLSSASWKDWPEFQQMCGHYWVMGKSGHGPRSVFKTRIEKKDHPITQGLTDFEADDELYAKLQGNAPITPLVVADSDWSKQTEPLAFIVEYGKGRVFHETFGHDGKALNNATVKKLIQRGCEWAAKGKVE